MKTLSGDAETQRLLGANAPRWIVQIDWANDSSWTGLYADQPLTISGNTYEAYVQSWGTMRLHLDYLRPGSGDDISIVMKNDDTEDFWSLSVANEAEGKPIRVGMWFTGLAAADITWMFVGHIESIFEHSARGTKITCVEFGRRKQKPLPLQEVTRTRFPSAPASSIGRMVPIVFGRVYNCPGVPVWGYSGSTENPRLYDPHDDVTQEIRLTNIWGLPPSGSVIVGTEQIRYNTTTWEYDYDGKTIAALLGCERGHNGTTAQAHADGVEIVVPRTHYILFADHECGLMFYPMVDDRQPASAFVKEIASPLFRRDAASLACHIEFTNRPPRYRTYKSEQVLKVILTGVGVGNDALDAESAFDEIEASSFATISDTNTPLRLEMTTDLTDFDNQKGAIVKARCVFEYEATDLETVDEITWAVAAIG